MTRSTRLLSALSVALLALVACPTWEETPEPPTPAIDDDDTTSSPDPMDEPVVLAPSVVVLDEPILASLQSVDFETGTLVFGSEAAGLADLEAGTVLASGATDLLPRGALRLVESVVSAADRITVETGPASLVEALESGAFSIAQQLSPDDIVSVETPTEGMVFPDEERGATWTFDTGTFGYGFNPAGPNPLDWVEFDGDLGMTDIAFELDAAVVWGGPDYFQAQFTTTLEGFAEVGWAVEEVSINDQWDIKTFGVAGGFLLVGGVFPVVWDLEVTPYLFIEGTFAGEGSAGLSAELVTSAEVTYSNGAWTFDGDLAPGFNAWIDIDGEYGIEVGFGVNVQLVFYWSGGPFLDVAAGHQKLVDMDADPCWRRGIHVEPSIGISTSAALAEFLDLEEVGVSWSFLEQWFTLATSGGPTQTYYPDFDLDGYGDSDEGELFCEAPLFWTAIGGDCNDGDPSVHPGATELCDGADQDCDDQVDEDCPSCFDEDNDGYGFGAACAGEDCDDDDPLIHPAAVEIACNDVDEDCDDVVQATGLGCPAAPSATATFDPTEDWILVGWSPVAGATGYRVYWATTPGVDESSDELGTTTSAEFAHSGVQPGFDYYYRVAAFDSMGQGELSPEVSEQVPASPPAAPTGVSASWEPASAWNLVTWDPVPDATSYSVYWGTAPGVTTVNTVAGPTTSVEFAHTGVVPGASYYYRVAASTGVLEGPLSGEVQVTIPAPEPAPATPVGVSAAWDSANGWNLVSWDAVSGATGYSVYWGTAPGVDSTSNVLPMTTTPEFGHSGLAPGSTYHYRVAAMGPGGTSGLSAEVASNVPVTTSSLAAPSGVVASHDAANGWILVDWEPVAGADGYTVYWGTSPGVTFSSNALPSTTTTEFGHSGVVAGTTYYYRVAGWDSSGDSPLSAEVDATVPATSPAPGTPAGVAASWDAGNGWILVDWSAVTDATSYTVYWGTSPGVDTGSNQLTPTTTTEYGHSGVVPGTTYYYRVAASNASGQGTLSAEVSATPPVSLAAPTGVAVVHDAASSWNYVTWGSVSGASEYVVYWGTGPGVTTSSNQLTPTVTTDYGHTGVLAGSTYYYRVAASDGATLGDLSTEVSVTVPTSGSPPSTPGSPAASWDASNAWNYITWDPTGGATSYTVYWGTSPGVDTGSNQLSPTVTTDYGHTGVVAGWTYYYRIAASNTYGQGPLSAEVSVTVPSGGSPPGQVTGLSGQWQTGPAWNYLDWSATSSADSYTVYWGTSPGVTTSSNALTPTTTTDYGHTGVVEGFTYYYRVAASNSWGQGPLSSEVSVSVPASGSPPGAPSALSASYEPGPDWNYVDWSGVSGATSYTVYWGTSPGVSTSSNQLTPTSTTDYGHTGVLPGFTYYYRVAASNAWGQGPLSGEVSAVTPPAAPTGLGGVWDPAWSWNYVTWNASSTATSYVVYWGTSPGVDESSNQLTPTTTLDYGHSGVVSGFTYYYRVAGVNVAGQGPLSSEIAVVVP